MDAFFVRRSGSVENLAFRCPLFVIGEALEEGRGLGLDHAAVRDRHPGSRVTYAVGDLLDLPRAWTRAFDLVVEIYTVQAVNRSVRAELTAGVRELAAPGGTLLVVQAVGESADDDGPPWPLTRPEIEAFGLDGLSAVSIDQVAIPGPRQVWRAEFRRT